MSSLSRSSEAQQTQWATFLTRLNEAVDEVFGEDGATIIVGGQFGDMGQPGQPICLVTGNVPVCAVSAALADMADEAEMLHRASHGLPETEEAEDFGEQVALADAPEEVQSMVRSLMEQYGVTEEQVQIINHVDTTDLASLPTTVEGTD